MPEFGAFLYSKVDKVFLREVKGSRPPGWPGPEPGLDPSMRDSEVCAFPWAVPLASLQSGFTLNRLKETGENNFNTFEKIVKVLRTNFTQQQQKTRHRPGCRAPPGQISSP